MVTMQEAIKIALQVQPWGLKLDQRSTVQGIGYRELRQTGDPKVVTYGLLDGLGVAEFKTDIETFQLGSQRPFEDLPGT